MKNYCLRFYSLMITVSIFIYFCSCTTDSTKTDKEKITDLIMEYAKNNVADFESFEIIELSDWDSTYTEISRENVIHNYVKSYGEVISNIEASQNEIQRINKYLVEIDEYIEQAKLNLEKIFYRIGDVVGYSSIGSKIRWGDTIEGMNTIKRANQEVDKLNQYKSDALTLRKHEENRQRELIQQERAIKEEVKVFCSNWEKKYIGKSIQMKCRLKNNNGYMNIKIYDVLCNDSLSNIINVADTTERHSFDNVKNFILHCYK
ncbi:MAG: hypothetical protein IJY95_05845 [Bacteroides sp.]|nr:hypothetical protein [Bacteroides sp.]